VELRLKISTQLQWRITPGFYFPVDPICQREREEGSQMRRESDEMNLSPSLQEGGGSVDAVAPGGGAGHEISSELVNSSRVSAS
jgi:hypothetical protein